MSVEDFKVADLEPTVSASESTVTRVFIGADGDFVVTEMWEDIHRMLKEKGFDGRD